MFILKDSKGGIQKIDFFLERGPRNHLSKNKMISINSIYFIEDRIETPLSNRLIVGNWGKFPLSTSSHRSF